MRGCRRELQHLVTAVRVACGVPPLLRQLWRPAGALLQLLLLLLLLLL
jgi:hypothetical protein